MKTWFITGISRGFGKALAEAALVRGDVVIGTVREGVPDVEASSGRLHVLPLEVTDNEAVKAAVARAFDLGGTVDVIVNNAGFGLLGAVEEASADEIKRVFDVNFFGPLNVIKAALPRLRAQGSGHIVNITSIAGRAPGAGSGIYAAAKHALEGLSSSLIQEVGPLGIKVTTIAPGAFRTDFLSDHSIRKSQALEGVYGDSVDKARLAFGRMAGNQAGDPARAAAAIIEVVEAERPPLHLLLGSDALGRARGKLEAVIDEIGRWEKVTQNTDYAAAN